MHRTDRQQQQAALGASSGRRVGRRAVALAVVSFSGITACGLWTKTAAAASPDEVADQRLASMGAPMGEGGSSASRDLASMGGGGVGGRGASSQDGLRALASED